MIIIKTEKEIDKMRRAGKKLARLLDELLLDIIKEGSNAQEIEKFTVDYIKGIGGKPSFKGYQGYPYATNVSLNSELIHGFPLKEKCFKNGDIISIDCGITLDGYIADSARTYIIGSADDDTRNLVEVTKESLDIGIKQAIINNRIGDISNSIQQYAEKKGFYVVREFVGHGVGRKLHESPQIPNYGLSNTGAKIKKNMTFAIEPMLAIGGNEIEILEDKWTVVTKNKMNCAHFEHTIVITEEGNEILTSLD